VNNPGTSDRKVTYHVRLREGPRSIGTSNQALKGRSLDAYAVPLINDGSSVEGSETEDISGPGSMERHTSGFGREKMLNPGYSSGSIGHLWMSTKGERLAYRFGLEPDFDTRLFETTVKGSRGTPPQLYELKSKAGYLSVAIGVGTDPEIRYVQNNVVMEGKYEYGTGPVKGNVSWKLRSEVAPCRGNF